MKKFYHIGSVEEFANPEIKRYRVQEHDIAVARVGDEFFAFDEICSHQYASLAEGWLEEFAIECPMHGARFDIRSGEVLSLPAVENIHTYVIEVRGDDIFVHMEG